MKTSVTILAIILSFWGSPAVAQTGQTLGLGYVFEEEIRIYQLYVPADYDGSESWPLVINMHGFGSSPGIQVFTSQINEIADTSHFLVAYPQGLLTTLPDGSSGLGMNTDWWTGRDDVGALSRLIDHVWTNYELDLSRVYAIGLDNGGQMSLALGCALNDRLAAVGGVSTPFTVFQRDNCMPSRPVPALLMHGTADLLTPFGGIPDFLLSAPELAAAWAGKNSCDAAPEESALPDIDTEDGSTVVLKVYQNCDDGAETRLYEIENGGHTWSDGPPVPPGFEILGNVNRDVNTSVELVHFFDRFSHPDPRTGSEVVEDETSSFQSRTMMIDGVERGYLLYVTEEYDGSEAWPLAIAMHGFATYSTEYFVQAEMHNVADTAHFLVAFPQGLNRESLGDTGPGWNVELDPGFADDVTFISNLIDEVALEFNVDRAKVYATGMSQGGVMTYQLANSLPHRIAAIAPVAALMPDPDSLVIDPGRPLPLVLIHGTEDGIWPYYTGANSEGFVPVISVPQALDIWRGFNGCAEDPLVTELPDIDTTDSSTVTRIAYENCDAGGEVVHYRVNGGGHTWPGSPTAPLFVGATNQDFKASVEIWNFFSRHVITPVTVEAEDRVLSNVSLEENYPHPFRHQTRIPFSLNTVTEVELVVYDVLGRKVAVLVDGLLPAGRHEVPFDAASLSNGLYLYTLKAGAQQRTRKMIVLR